jgi:hypothetical protein
MNIDIDTSSPDQVDPAEIADALREAGYLVLTIDVNEGERVWVNPEFSLDEEMTS